MGPQAPPSRRWPLAAPITEPDSSQSLLTIEEVATRLRTTPSAVYSSRYRGQAPGSLGMRSGKRLLFDWSEVDRWLRSTRPRVRP